MKIVNVEEKMWNAKVARQAVCAKPKEYIIMYFEFRNEIVEE